MATSVLMPQAGISVESCIITEWLKKPGDTVAVGDILFSYETDKASFECESTAEGTLLERFFEDGDEVPVLVPVCAVGKPGEDTSALRPAGAASAPAVQEQETVVPAVPSVPPASVAPLAAAGTAGVSPRARRLASEQHVDLRLAVGTGPYGRVIERDVRSLLQSGTAATSAAATSAAATSAAATSAAATSAAAAAVQQAPAGAYAGSGIGGRVAVGDLVAPAAAATPAVDAPEYEDIAFSGIRRAIAASMTRSLATIPQLTHHFSFDASELLAYRQLLKQSGEMFGMAGVTLGDLILYAVSRLLPRYPDLNAHMLEETGVRRFRDVNLGFACDTARGLMVPVISQANRKSLAQISAEVKELAAAAQSGALSPDRMTGGTFTVSNLGVLGVESFTPVINPPQTGILGVDAIVQRPYEVEGAVRLYPAMGLSLTYDHRAIDGAPASRFMQELCGALEKITLLLGAL